MLFSSFSWYNSDALTESRLASTMDWAAKTPLNIAFEIPSAKIGSANPAESPIKKTLFLTKVSVLGETGITNPWASSVIISLMPKVFRYSA